MEKEFKNKHGTVVIRGQPTGIKEATKKMFKEVEKNGKGLPNRHASGDGD